MALPQDEHHPLLRPSLFQPALSLSGAASLARVDSSFGMRALEKLNPQGVPVTCCLSSCRDRLRYSNVMRTALAFALILDECCPSLAVLLTCFK